MNGRTTQEKIKVLHLIKSLGRGGAEMLLQETLKQHDRTKFEFHYIFFLPWKDQMVAGLRENGGVVVNFPAKDNIRIALQAGKIIRYIKDNKITILHCHLPWAGFVGRFIHSRIKMPVIYSEHNKQERYHSITKTINKLTFNRQTKVIAVSNDVAESIQKNIRPTVDVQTILNGVNTSRFVRDELAGLEVRKQHLIPKDAVFIGTIAVFRFQKRLKEWIDLFKIMHARFPALRGCIVGDGILNPEIRNHLKSQEMEEFIVMPGLQVNVLPYLSAFDIFLMTSEFEGLPVALLEAMSMQCAVVCTDAGGIKEVIRDGVDGFMKPVTEWRSLEQPLTRLIEAPAELKKFGLQARQRVIEKFSVAQMVDAIEEVYEQLAVKHNPTTAT